MIRRVVLAWLLVLAATVSSWARGVHYDVSLSIDPSAATVEGRATVRPVASAGTVFALSPDLAVRTLRIAGETVDFRRDGRRIYPDRPFGPSTPLDVVYGGTAKPLEHRGGPFLDAMRLGAEGGVLPEAVAWYPVAGPIGRFRLDLTVAGGQIGIAPGRLVREDRDGDVYRAAFAIDHPIDGLPVFTGPYEVAERMAGATRLRTYFHPELAGKSESYLEATARYLDLYSGQIGPYPYPAFHVVSSPLPVGLGYPYLTYIGRRVLQLPFILYTSLPHEVLHSWWGNGVFIDYGSGNWAEGLTTYMADYALTGRRGPRRQRDMRARWLADYAALPASRETALVDFRARIHGAAQVVGYHKAAMVFHMLEARLGTPTFRRGLQAFWDRQRFKVAGWRDLRAAFEEVSGEDLSAYFAQWLDRRGAPELTLANVSVMQGDNGYEVRFHLGQTGTPYALRIPIRLETERGTERTMADLSTNGRTVTIRSPARPRELSLDPDFDLFRRLPPGDAPALLREVMLAETVALSVEPGDTAFADAARALADRLAEGALGDATAAGPRLLIGRPDWIADRAEGRLAPPSGVIDEPGSSARVWVRRDDGGRLHAMIAARDTGSLAALMRPLPHYGSKSYLAFEGRRAKVNGIWNEPPRSTTVRFD